jgi:hypothetical protein
MRHTGLGLFAPFAFAFAMTFVSAFANAGEPAPRDVVKRATDAGAPTSISETVTMTLVDAKGSKSTRAMTIARKKIATGGANTRIEFLEPKDVAGTVLLSLDKAAGSGEQYLYLPGLKRTRRLSGAQRTGSFQGTDFAYEDLAQRDLDAADYQALPDEKIGDAPCFAVEATPKKGTDSGYGKSIVYVRRSDFLIVRVRYFDSKGAELKVLDVDAAKVKSEGDLRIPLHLEMKMLKDGHVTTLDVGATVINAPLDDARFDPASLDRG